MATDALQRTIGGSKPGSAGVPPAASEVPQWRSRGYLPHFDGPNLTQLVAFRLADSLPSDVVKDIKVRSNESDTRGRTKRIEELLDSSRGACYLKVPKIAEIVQDAFFHLDGMAYVLIAWVIMPNHAHMVVETRSGHSLSSIVQAWKSYTAKKANRILGRKGRFWQPEYFDRLIRDDSHLAAVIEYVHNNPVKAGLVQTAEMWPFSSATTAGETPALRDSTHGLVSHPM